MCELNKGKGMKKSQNGSSDNAGLVILAIFVTFFSAWVTHIIACLASAKYLLLIAGAFIFPVGIIHGISVWFGMGW